MVEGEQIYGDGVNVAARLESLAEPGGICISDTAHAQVKNKLAFNYEDRGAQSVKNIAEPVRVYRVLRVPALSTSAMTMAMTGAILGREMVRTRDLLRGFRPRVAKLIGQIKV